MHLKHLMPFSEISHCDTGELSLAVDICEGFKVLQECHKVVEFEIKDGLFELSF